MGRIPNRTCEPVMVNKEDTDIIDKICAERYGEDILTMSRRKELVARRKEVFHEIISEGMKSLEQKAIKKEKRAAAKAAKGG